MLRLEIVAPDDPNFGFSALGMLLFHGDIAGHAVHVVLVAVGGLGLELGHQVEHAHHGQGADLGHDGVIDAAGDVAMG